MNLQDTVKEYLALGGLFNPELMEHEKVRDLVVALRDRVDLLENMLREASDIIEDTTLTGEHSVDCQYINTGKPCDCMDRNFFSERNNSQRSRAYELKYKDELERIRSKE